MASPSLTQIPPTPTVGPTSTPWLDTILPQAEGICSNVENSGELADQRPIPTGYLILRKEIEDTGNSEWRYYDVPKGQARTHQDIHSLVCIAEYLSASAEYQDGATGFSRDWTIYVVNWSNGELLYVGSLTSAPPNIKFGSGNAYADEPTEALVGLLDAASRKGFAYDSGGFSIAISPDGSKLVTNNPLTDSLELWDTQADTLIWSVKRTNTSGFPMTTPIFTSDGQHAILGTEKGEVQWFDIEDGRISRTIKGTAEIQGLALSPDGSLLAFRDPDQIIIVDATSGSAQLTIDTGYHSDSHAMQDSFDLSFSVDDSFLATRSSNTVDIWDLSKKMIVHQVPVTDGFAGGFGYRECVQFLPDGKRLAVCNHDDPFTPTISLWDIDTWQKTGGINLPPNTTGTFMLASRNQNWLAVSDGCKVYLYNANSLELEKTIQAGNIFCWGVGVASIGFALTSDSETMWVSFPLLGLIPYEIP